MAESYYNAASGNWSTAANWKGGTNGDGTLPTSADDVYANGKTITIDQNIGVKSLRTTAGTTAIAGGSFSVSTGGKTLTIDGPITAGSSTCLSFSAASGNTLTINGTGLTVNGSAATTSARGIFNSSTGTINVTGNVTAGNASSAAGVYNSSTGTINVTGNVTGGGNTTAAGADCGSGTITVSGSVTGATGPGMQITTGTGSAGSVVGGTGSSGYGVILTGAGTLTVAGNVTGGSSANAWGITLQAAGSVTVNGNVTGGSAAGANGCDNSSTGTMTINGSVTGGTVSVTAFGAFNRSTGKLLCNGAINASATTPAISDTAASAGFVRVTGPITNSTGINAITCTRLCLVAECDWTIAKAGTPPAYNGTVTIGLKGGSGGGRILRSSIIGAIS